MKTEALGHWPKSKLVKMYTSRIIQEESVGIKKGNVNGKDGERGYTLITEDGTETARNRSHIMPVPVDYATQDSDVRPSLLSDDSTSPAEIHEDLEVNQDSLPANSADPDPANAPLRKSSRIKKEKKVCHSCHDCHLIETYLSSEVQSQLI